jgi:hypothetical protein
MASLNYELTRAYSCGIRDLKLVRGWLFTMQLVSVVLLPNIVILLFMNSDRCWSFWWFIGPWD